MHPRRGCAHPSQMRRRCLPRSRAVLDTWPGRAAWPPRGLAPIRSCGHREWAVFRAEARMRIPTRVEPYKHQTNAMAGCNFQELLHVILGGESYVDLTEGLQNALCA